MNISFEQIEKLRSMANITYEEAKEILEKYDGDMVKAILELEKAGKVRGNRRQPHAEQESQFVTTLKEWFRKGNENRLVVKDGDDVILNFSINFSLIALIFGFHLFIVGLIVALILGYKIRFRKKEGKAMDFAEFAQATARKVKETVNDFDNTKTDTEVKKDEDGYNEMTIE